MLSWLFDRIIAYAIKRNEYLSIVRHEDQVKLLTRYIVFRRDEWVSPTGKVYDKLPWWCPFNLFVHEWTHAHNEQMHDHPRWSITVVLKDTIVEHTPWNHRVLTPGSIVFRTHKTIHALTYFEGEQPWTLFIVGRRKHRQNGYTVKPF